MEAGLELAAEQPLEPVRHARRISRVDEAVEDEEAVVVEARDLSGTQVDHGQGVRMPNQGRTLPERQAHA
jgi:hypothetical protein